MTAISLVPSSPRASPYAASTATRAIATNYLDRLKVGISSQVRRVTKVIRSEMRRRAAIEAI